MKLRARFGRFHRWGRAGWLGGLLVVILVLIIGVGPLGDPAAGADSVPSPGNPGRLFSPAFSLNAFSNPGAALRPKFRWWQPLADTNNAEIRTEVRDMANDGGGGFEQVGFPVNLNLGGVTPQFASYADSQVFGALYGWGSPLWSLRTRVYQTAAARDGVIGDMNEGARWNNTVPTVYSPNQPVDAQDLSYGVQQYQPGANPSGELPPTISPGPAGESTTLSTPAGAGSATLQVQSTAGLLAGDQITLGAGTSAENAMIRAVGTASPAVPLSQPVKAGSRVVHVPPATAAQGVPGTPSSPAQFTAGQKITIGSGPDAQSDTIKSVGTFDIAVPTSLAAPACAGGRSEHEQFPHGCRTTSQVAHATTNVEVASNANFLVGDTITIEPGTSRAESRVITSVGAAGTGTTLAHPARAGSLAVRVASTAGMAPGDVVTIGSATDRTSESDRIVSLPASPTPTAPQEVLLYTPLRHAHSSHEPVALQGIGVSFKPALTVSHAFGASAIDTGTGLTLTSPLRHGHPTGDTLMADGTGVTLKSPLVHSHQAGDNTSVTNTLSTSADAGALSLEVSSAGGFEAGDQITIGQAGYTETATIATGGVGTPGASGTALTLTAALSRFHYAGDPVVDATSRSIAPTTLVMSSAMGVSPATIDVSSAAGFNVGDHVTIGASGATDQDTINAIGTTGAGAQGGTVLTLNFALTHSHSAKEPVIDPANPGSNASAGLSDIEIERPVAVELAQCLSPDQADPLTSPSTALSAAAAPGATQIDVADISNLAPGDQLTVDSAGAAETRTIAPGGVRKTGSEVVLTKPLTSGHNTGAAVYDTCSSTPGGGTRELDPNTVTNVTSQSTSNALDWTAGTLDYSMNGGVLPVGNGQPWELIDFYSEGDVQSNSGGTATTPNQWLGHLSVASAQAMADYFDKHILNSPATRAAIRYEDVHSGTPAVFEDSLEDSSFLKWVPNMISSWRSYLGYDPTQVLPAIAGVGQDATSTPVFDFPESDGQGATLGWRVRQDYDQMWSDLYVNDYLPTLDHWASTHGMVARFQSYGDPIDEGQAAATEGIPEGEHYEFASEDETQQFKVIASGTYMNGNKVVSDECCEDNAAVSSAVWADTWGLDGTGSGPPGSTDHSTAQSVYADMAGGDTQIVFHGWPYTTGAAGGAAIWPGFTYGGDEGIEAANGPNMPAFVDDKQDNMNIARLALTLRQGEASFDVGVYHQDLGLAGQGADNVTTGEDLGPVVSGGVAQASPTSGKILRSSSSLAQAGYTYGYLSPEFFRYQTARFTPDPVANSAADTKVLFPGQGDYRALVIYDQTVMPPDVAQRIADLAEEGLPIVIVGQVPSAAPSVSGTATISGMQAADAQVQTAMKQVLNCENSGCGGSKSPTVMVVADSAAPGSQSSDANLPAALGSLGITPAMALPSWSSYTPAPLPTTAQPVQDVRRYDPRTDVNYYYLFNPNLTSTVYPTVTLTGLGTPYALDAWGGTISPLAGYSRHGDRLTLSVRLAPGNYALIAISPTALGHASKRPQVHATATTANATPSASDNVAYDPPDALVARASRTGTYKTTLSTGVTVKSRIAVPSIGRLPGATKLTQWRLWVDSWGPTPSGDPTRTRHVRIPQTGTLRVAPLARVTSGALPSWTQITPQNGFSYTDNLMNAAGIGTYTTTFTLSHHWSPKIDGAYLNIGVAVDTVDIWINGTRVTALDQNDRNQIDAGPYLRAGLNTLKITVATPLRNAVAVSPAYPASGQIPDSSEALGAVQGGGLEENMGLIGPVTLAPYGQSAPLSPG